MVVRLVQVLLTLLTGLFVYIGYIYHDFFYYLLAFATFTLVVSLSFTKKYSDKRITFPKLPRWLINLISLKIFHKIYHGPKLKAPSKKIWIFSSVDLYSFIIFTSLFTYITIYKLPSNLHTTNIVLSYYSTQIIWFQQKIVYLLLLLVVFIFFILSKRKHNRESLTIKTLSKSVTRIFLSLFFGFNLALFLVFIIGISEANLLALRSKLLPSSTSIVWGQTGVLNRVKTLDKPPQIVGTDYGLKKTILSLDARNIGFSQFYEKQVIPRLPDPLLILLKFPNEALVMFDNYLFISEIKKSEIEVISPLIAKLFVKQTLEPRLIKDEPLVSILSRQEYLQYRDDQINKRLQEIDEALSSIQTAINTLYGNIQNDKNEIASYESAINSANSNRETEYNNCKNATCYTYSYSYYTGYYSIPYKCYSETYCNKVKSYWDNLITEYQSNLQGWKNQLSNDQGLLTEYQGYKQYFDDVRTLVETQKDSVLYELGVFEPDNSVKVVLENTSNTAVADYFATLVHEYLHYTSYVSEDRTLPQFFEEGLTEYFARKIIKNQLRTSTNIGYPHLVRVIQEMMKKIPEKEFEQIYFTKDEKLLIASLNNTYGSKFYKESEYYFWAMSLVSLQDALKFTNNIMFRIGGTELTEQDILSTYEKN